MTKRTLEFKHTVCSKCKHSRIKQTTHDNQVYTDFRCTAKNPRIKGRVCSEFK